MNTTVTLGIVTGLATALLQSFSYIFSRRYILRKGSSGGVLFSVSHIQMGILSIVTLPFTLHSFPSVSVIMPLLGTAGFYLAAQWVLFRTLRHHESSQITPLLGLKIPLTGIFLFLLFGKMIHPLGWFAICLCAAGSMIISPPRGRIEIKLLATILIITAGYSGSDISIPHLINRMKDVSNLPIVAALCLTYIFCGIIGTIVLFYGNFKKNNPLSIQIQTLIFPYSITWFLSIGTLFVCFSQIGPVFGSMLQATRGIISVMLGALLTYFGYLTIENLSSRRILLFRLFGGLVITGAIVLYMFVK